MCKTGLRKQSWRRRAPSALIRRNFSVLRPGYDNPVTIITDPLFYALAVPAVVALGLSKGGFAGMGQMATPLLALVMPPLEAAAIMLPIMIVQDAVAVWVYRKEWDGRVIAIMLPGAVVGIGIAWALAAHISEAMVRVFVGAIAIAFVLYNWIGVQRVEREIGTGQDRRRRVLGRALGLYHHHLPGRRTALPDLRAGAAAVEDGVYRHQRHVLRHRERAQGRCPMPRSVSSPPGGWRPRWCCCRWRSPPTARLLAGAAHAAEDCSTR